MLRLLQSVPQEKLRLGYACERLYEEGSWRTLPHEISELVRQRTEDRN